MRKNSVTLSILYALPLFASCICAANALAADDTISLACDTLSVVSYVPKSPPVIRASSDVRNNYIIINNSKIMHSVGLAHSMAEAMSPYDETYTVPPRVDDDYIHITATAPNVTYKWNTPHGVPSYNFKDREEIMDGTAHIEMSIYRATGVFSKYITVTGSKHKAGVTVVSGVCGRNDKKKFPI